MAFWYQIDFWRNETLKARNAARITLGMLWGVFLAKYVAAKFDFIVRYDPYRVGTKLGDQNGNPG